MLTAGFIALLLLSIVTLLLTLSRSRRSEQAGASLAGGLVELREKFLRELSALRERMDSESRRAERHESRLAELSEAEERREDETALARELASRADETPRDDSARDEARTGGEGEAGAGGEASGVRSDMASDANDVHALARSIEEFFNATTHPRELLDSDAFIRGVELSRGVENSTFALLARSTDADVVVACMSLEALARREGIDADSTVADSIVGNINIFYYWPRFFALRALDAHAAGPSLLASLLARLNSSWRDYMPLQMLRDFAARRTAAGDRLTPEQLIGEVESQSFSSEQVTEVGYTLKELGGALPAEVGEELARWNGEREAVEFLKTFGRVWESGGRKEPANEVFLLDPVAARVAELEAAVKREPARSVLLVGESGTGKTAMLRALAERLRGERWVVFEAGAAEVLAGQQYIGQLEERVRSIVRQIGDKRVLWVVPNFHETLWAGRHKYSPVSVLDLLLPSIESGTVRVIGEVPSNAYEQLVRLRPKLRTAMQTCRVAPLSDEETLELGRRWAARREVTKHAWEGAHEGIDTSHALPRVTEGILREALQLARQYLGDKAAPGNLMLLLDATHSRLVAEGEGEGAITLDDLLVTLSQLTGLPVQMLDEREGLDISELRAFFERRVLGQPEAVDCLVERVAMIKAGLTDPTRPQGVFLFVGPTGTGKTEIAKTLAEFLFGSHERMIRLDMSELQTWESQARILGDADETSDSTALVNLIRKQPFSVVLLDEFEKAHPTVWDLFLQVFDDGRLTDKRGLAADFRHCVVIMTSNLGATLPVGASIGFSQEQAQFAAGAVERAVGRAFRREFVNRIDRVVVFRPLGRAVMRDLLRKELSDVLHRRGLRTRQWAVEWDESAIEFLLEQGFTADLGARPLKRAVERYLLSPLAMTIVNHQFPEGDQFLFVRQSSDGLALDVQFVDPDAPQPTDATEPSLVLTEEDEEPSAAAAGELRLEAIALDSRGTHEEVLFLREKFDEVAERVEDEVWARRKEDALREMQSADFWASPARFAALGAVEYMDRIEAGLGTAGRLLARLRGERKRLPPDLVARLAEQLYLLDSACRSLAAGEPRDAFLLVQASREPGTDWATSDRFARRLAQMYRRWAERRRMRFEVIEEGDGSQDNGGSGAGEYRALVAVSGYAAYTILRDESGLHVLETPQDEKSFNRARASVRVVAQPDEPAGHGTGALRLQAERALESDAGAPGVVVRRYREEPSPLVRDSARGWRTGKLERVLDGDFDLIT
ncbi:MAG: ATP-dependent Clp protease ATP-binding subunit [Rubrivivax sp.]|nr:ATP-dependent Clp protease ATP-binding subunit [Pyrinomonadaceae bacterium]